MFVPVSEAGHVAKSRSHSTERSQTNNSSIISKRSVERLYLSEPHFFRYFVRKPQRRSPTINRGYWLRMRAVEHVVREFLGAAEASGESGVWVVSKDRILL
jgi:tRNA wybutosine-synthesizing protein 4